jgi:hypothetical protein
MKIHINETINPFSKSMASINEKLSKIDEFISESRYDNALSLIDELMELAPGPEVGEIVPRSGEIYWRRLLANSKCKNDLELLCKGRLLHNNEIYEAAVRYASENEKPVYEFVKNTEDLIVELLEKALAKKEIEDKNNKNPKKLLEEYKQKLGAAEKLAQENVKRLEEIEKSIHEQVIDCTAVVGEYKHTLNDILTNARGVGDSYKSDITYEEKVGLEKQLDTIIAKSEAEFGQLGKIKDTHLAFREYSEMVNKQKTIISEVNRNIDDIKGIRFDIRALISSIEKIAEDYGKAQESLNNGNYELAKKLITQECFNELIKQALKGR